MEDGVKLVGCEQSYDGVAPVAIVEFPSDTGGDGTDVPGAGWAEVEFIGASVPDSVSEESASVTVYAGSVEPVGSKVFGAVPVEVEDNSSLAGCRIVGIGQNGPTEQKMSEGTYESVEGPLVPYETQPPGEIQVAYENSPGAA